MRRPSDASYKAELGLVLQGRDPDALHLFLRLHAAGYGDARQIAEVEGRSHGEMEELMHRMILVRPDLADLHAASRAWLSAHSPGQPLSAETSVRRFEKQRRAGREASQPRES